MTKENNCCSFDNESFKEYFIKEDLLQNILKNIPFKLIFKIKLENYNYEGI